MTRDKVVLTPEKIVPAETAFDGDDPWWAIAATHPHARPPASRHEAPRHEHADPPKSPSPSGSLGPRLSGGDFLPRAPETLADSGVGECQLEALVLKFLLSCGTASGREIAEQLKMPFPVLVEQLARMKHEQLVAYKAAASMNDFEHQLTPGGCDQARRYSEQCTYFGAAPVPLDDYTAGLTSQSLRRQQPRADRLRQALSNLVVSRGLFSQLGQALQAGTAMFLYGDPGNGKTSIAERVINAFGPYLWIPRAISVWGEVIRIYDPAVHTLAPLGEAEEAQQKIDGRWVRIRRPTIITGGELTRNQLELHRAGATGIIEAPLHMKSNGGSLVIDDFGRQRIGTTELLNRWIVPLDRGYDYLNLPSGRKIQVPFDQLIIFATNLEPRELVDEAFLRRIPYKIEIHDPSEEEFRELLRTMAPKLSIEYRESPVNYLISKHYHEAARRFRYCHPRDLLLQIRNFCLFHEQAMVMTNEGFDTAVKNYFAVM